MKKLIIITILMLSLNIAYATCLTQQININSAPQQELTKLDGVGPTYAQRIIDARPFSNIEELTKINGIGPATLEKIKNQGLACTTTSEENSTKTETITLEPTKVNLNNASLKELEKLTGVGPVTAKSIAESRPFYSIDDLLNVIGIGPATLEKIKNQGLAWVQEQERPEEKQETNSEKETENIINLEQQETITGKVVYESKTEIIRKYAIYIFSALLVLIIFLIIKR